MLTSAEAAIGPVRTACKLLALLFLLVVATALSSNFVNPYAMDFSSYWAAAVLALDGNPAGAYDLAVHGAVQSSAVTLDGPMPFAYPPPFLILLLPFGLLPFAAAAALWVVTTYGFYFAAAKRLLPDSGWLVAAFPAVLVNGIIAQNAFLIAAILIVGLLVLPKRPFIAGMVLGCLVIKPHLGLLLPLAFVAARQWRAFAGATLSSAGLLLLGLMLFGWAPYSAWLAQAPLYASIVTDGLVGWHKMASVYASLRLAGLPPQAAWTVHVLIALAAAGTVWRVWRSGCEPAAKGAALAAATALVSPYLYVYDTLILIVPFLWLVTVERNRTLLAVLWCTPLISFAQNFGYNGTVNLMPLVPLTLLVLITRHVVNAPWDKRARARPGSAVGFSSAGSIDRALLPSSSGFK